MALPELKTPFEPLPTIVKDLMSIFKTASDVEITETGELSSPTLEAPSPASSSHSSQSADYLLFER